MAGLGTGAAPFRAFLQHRAWLVQQGHQVGPVYYYFGSRHQSQEYLYGEEIETFLLDGIITRAGLAFSRDGPQKVYIQHKMLEDSEVLARMLHDDGGVFYLCGPTWPVPDIYETLIKALVQFTDGQDAETAAAYLEGLKEEERYVLEVCYLCPRNCLVLMVCRCIKYAGYTWFTRTDKMLLNGDRFLSDVREPKIPSGQSHKQHTHRCKYQSHRNGSSLTQSGTCTRKSCVAWQALWFYRIISTGF